MYFAKTITDYWRSHNKKQIAEEAINYLVFPAHMEILILCIHENMIGIFSLKLIFSSVECFEVFFVFSILVRFP